MGKLWDIVQDHIDSSPYPPSERQVAKKLGMSPTGLANWRYPRGLPAAENLRALARLAGVPYSTVLEAALADTGYTEAHDGQPPMTQAGASPAAESHVTVREVPPPPEFDPGAWDLAAHPMPPGGSMRQQDDERADAAGEESQDPPRRTRKGRGRAG